MGAEQERLAARAGRGAKIIELYGLVEARTLLEAGATAVREQSVGNAAR